MNPAPERESKTRPRPGLPAAALSWFAGVFVRHLPSKVAALVLALLLWFTIRQELTETETFEVRVEVDLPAGLMLVDTYRPYSRVQFRGPRAQIETLKKLENTVVTLRVRAEDLLGQDQATLAFSVERRNLRHSYGPDVAVVGTEPAAPIELRVAARQEKTVPVLTPRVENLPQEWEARVDLTTPNVRLTGPAPVVRALTGVEPEPVNAEDILARRGAREDIERLPLERRLSPAERARLLTLAEGETIRCLVTLTRSRVPKDFTVPFTVYFERSDWPVTLVPNETDRLKKSGDGWTILLTFSGTPADLEILAEAVAAGQVRAYVFAEDFEAYRQVEEDRGYLEPVHVEMPDTLRRRVVLKAPPRESIEVDTKKR